MVNNIRPIHTNIDPIISTLDGVYQPQQRNEKLDHTVKLTTFLGLATFIILLQIVQNIAAPSIKPMLSPLRLSYLKQSYFVILKV